MQHRCAATQARPGMEGAPQFQSSPLKIFTPALAAPRCTPPEKSHPRTAYRQPHHTSMHEQASYHGCHFFREGDSLRPAAASLGRPRAGRAGGRARLSHQRLGHRYVRRQQALSTWLAGCCIFTSTNLCIRVLPTLSFSPSLRLIRYLHLGPAYA